MNELVLFTTALRAAVPTQPDPNLEAALVPRLAAAARAATLEAETRVVRRGAAERLGTARRRPRSPLASVARVGIVVALIPLVLAALAFAGVTVPSPARDAFHSLGVNLPNQPSDDSPGSAGQPSSHPDQHRTSATPSKGNSVAAHQHALAQHAKAKGKALGHRRGESIGLKELTAPGLSGETGAPDHSNAGGSPQGQAHSQAAPQPHTAHVPSGRATGHFK